MLGILGEKCHVSAVVVMCQHNLILHTFMDIPFVSMSPKMSFFFGKYFEIFIKVKFTVSLQDVIKLSGFDTSRACIILVLSL